MAATWHDPDGEHPIMSFDSPGEVELRADRDTLLTTTSTNLAISVTDGNEQVTAITLTAKLDRSQVYRLTKAGHLDVSPIKLAALSPDVPITLVWDAGPALVELLNAGLADGKTAAECAALVDLTGFPACFNLEQYELRSA